MHDSKFNNELRVFIASPGDLALERKRFRDCLQRLNHGFGEGIGVHLHAMGWEDTLAEVGRRPQDVINDEISSCDVFILVLHRRWGQHRRDKSPYSSYTEEEFELAYRLFKERGRPQNCTDDTVLPVRIAV
jgi:hypothetical protein